MGDQGEISARSTEAEVASCTPSRTKLDASESASTNLWPRMAIRMATLEALSSLWMPSASPAMNECTWGAGVRPPPPRCALTRDSEAVLSLEAVASL